MLLAITLRVILAIQPTSLVSVDALRYAVEEAACIWARYDVLVDGFTVLGTLAPPGSTVVTVRAAAMTARESGTSRPLGLIDFDTRGLPIPAVAVNYAGLLQLLGTLSFAGRRAWQWPDTLRDRIVGRALGRVLAHELGHFLLASKRHATHGLMRADHHVTELVLKDDDPYRLDEASSQRLRANGLRANLAAEEK